MRAAIAIVIASLTLGLGYGPVRAQTRGDVPALESIRMIDALIGWAVTSEQEAERFLRTTDGGIHWRDVTPFLSSGQKISVEKVAVLTSLIAWVLSGELFHTVDGGRTWSNEDIPGGWVQSMQFIDPRDGWIVSVQGANMASVEQDIYGSTDGGQTWIKAASTRPFEATGSGLDLQLGLYFDFAFLNATTGWVTGISLAEERVYLYVTHDGGRTWHLQKLPLPLLVTSPWGGVTRPPTFFTARHGILPVFYDNLNSQSYRPIASFAIFYVTNDGGMTWTSTTPVSTAHSGIALDRRGQSLRTYSFVDANHGWLADGDVLYATSDGGHHWMKISPTELFTDVRQIDFISSWVGWAVRQTSPFLLKTLDGGHTWAPVPYFVSP